MQARIIVNLNIISVVIEKSKIFGADFISMVSIVLVRCKEAASSRSKV